MKKLFALLLALTLVVSLAAPVFAAEPTVSVTITHIADDHQFTAYQIFDGTLTADGVLTDIQWGVGVDGAALLAALKADTTEIWNSDHTASVKFSDLFATAATAEDVVHILEDFTSDGVRLDQFADLAKGCIVAAEGVLSNSAITDNGNGTYTYTIEGLDPGYYLIDDTTADANVGAEDYRTHYILALTTHTSLTTKGNYPVVDKTVSETLDGTYSEYIADQLNKIHYFKWDVHIDDRISEFDTYYLGFDDVMSKGMTFNALEEVYFLQADNSKVYLYQNGSWVAGSEPTTFSVVTESAGTRLDGTRTYTAEETYIQLIWSNLLAAFPAAEGVIAGDDRLVVKYSAYLNEDAVYGEPMDNDVFIKFSNGPDANDFGYSLPDYAFVFSFGMKVIKVDADNNEIVLPGAQFVLYHMHGSEKHYAYVENGKAVAWTPYLTQEEAYAAIDADDTITDKAAAKAEAIWATTLVTDTNGNIHVDGLDEDTLYYLHETMPPTGYNTMFTDVEFSIHPAYTTGTDGVPVVASITYNVDGYDHTLSSGADFEAGRIVVTVLNDKGNTLPSTGGIGTTIFYLVGGMMTAAAVVLLVTKKRMAV